MKKIIKTTVDHRAYSQAEIKKVEFHKVGELFVSLDDHPHYGYSVSVEPFGNACTLRADSPKAAAQQVALDYDDYLVRCKRTAAPISQSYIDRFGTGME